VLVQACQVLVAPLELLDIEGEHAIQDSSDWKLSLELQNCLIQQDCMGRMQSWALQTAQVYTACIFTLAFKLLRGLAQGVTKL